MKIAAYGAALAVPTTADAVIIYSGPQNITVTNPGVTSGLQVGTLQYLDQAGNNGPFRAAVGVYGTYTGPSGSVFSATNITAFLTLQTSGIQARASGAAVVNLMSGAVIGPGNGPYAVGYSFPGLGNFSGTTGFAGLNFTIAGNTHYGWLRLVFDPVDQEVQLIDWAYESVADTAIAAGDTTSVPLPATLPLAGLGVLALGAVGLRRRRAEKAA